MKSIGETGVQNGNMWTLPKFFSLCLFAWLCLTNVSVVGDVPGGLEYKGYDAGARVGSVSAMNSFSYG